MPPAAPSEGDLRSDRGAAELEERATAPAPLLPPALGFMAGIWLADAVGPVAGWARSGAGVLVVGLVLPLWLGRARSSRAVALGLLGLAAVPTGFLREQARTHQPPHHVSHLLAAEPRLVRVAGRIACPPQVAVPEKFNPYSRDEPARTRFVLALETLEHDPAPTALTGQVRVTIHAPTPNLALGNRVLVTGWLSRIRPPGNPGERDWQRHDELQNVAGTLRVESAELVRTCAPPNLIDAAVNQLRGLSRAFLLDDLSTADDEPAQRLLDALVLGQRSAVERAVNEAFVRTGTVHFLSVSGFHVGLLTASMWFLLRRVVGLGRRATALLTLPVILLYTGLAEPNAPILRSAVMGVLACLAGLLGRPLALLNWLAASALIVLLLNPGELFSAGFQLSFLQVLVLCTIVPRLYRRLTKPGAASEDWDAHTFAELVRRRAFQLTLGMTLVSICTWLAAAPLSLYHFGQFSPLGALHSILLTIPIALIVWTGFVALLGAALFPPLSLVAGGILARLTGWLLAGVPALASLPGTLVQTRCPPAALVLLTYAAAGWAAWRLAGPAGKRDAPPTMRRWRRRTALLSGALVAAAWLAWAVAPLLRATPAARVHVFAVGSGSAILVQPPGRDGFLIDAGTIANANVGVQLTDAFRVLHVSSLRGALISHANFDHFSGMHTLLAANPDAPLYVTDYFAADREGGAGVRRFWGLAGKPPVTARCIHAGDQIGLGPLRLDVLWPPRGLPADWRANDVSLVLALEAFGQRVLIPGDAEDAALAALVARHDAGELDLSAEVLIAPHHGSVVPTHTAALLRAVSPRLILVSTGKTRPEFDAVVRQTLGPGVPVVYTRAAGMISVAIQPDGAIEHSTFR